MVRSRAPWDNHSISIPQVKKRDQLLFFFVCAQGLPKRRKQWYKSAMDFRPQRSTRPYIQQRFPPRAPKGTSELQQGYSSAKHLVDFICAFQREIEAHELTGVRLHCPYLSELEVAGNMCTPSGLPGTCLGGARYAGLDPLGRPSPRPLLADTLTKYGSPVSSSVMVYHREEELVAPLLSPTDAEDDSVAGMVVDSRLDGLAPRTELP